jgi:hypothetical protein
LLFISQEEIDGYEDFEEHLMGPPWAIQQVLPIDRDKIWVDQKSIHTNIDYIDKINAKLPS